MLASSSVVSQYILKEVVENLAPKAPEALPAFQQLMDLAAPEMVENPTTAAPPARQWIDTDPATKLTSWFRGMK